jgi:hypothetical protein
MGKSSPFPHSPIHICPSSSSVVVALVVLVVSEVLTRMLLELVSFVVLACRDEEAGEEAILPFSVWVEDSAETLWGWQRTVSALLKWVGSRNMGAYSALVAPVLRAFAFTLLRL